MAVTNQPADDDVPCPLCGDYSGPPASVEAHISRKVDPDHKGEVGQMYRDELQGPSTSESGGEPADESSESVDPESVDDFLADLDSVADEVEDAGEAAADEIADDDADHDDAELVEDDDPDDDPGRAEQVKADAKPDAGAVGTAAGASLLGAPFLLDDIPTKWIVYGGLGVLAVVVVLYLLDQQDDDTEQQDQNQQQNQPKQPKNVGGGLVST